MERWVCACCNGETNAFQQRLVMALEHSGVCIVMYRNVSYRIQSYRNDPTTFQPRRCLDLRCVLLCSFVLCCVVLSCVAMSISEHRGSLASTIVRYGTVHYSTCKECCSLGDYHRTGNGTGCTFALVKRIRIRIRIRIQQPFEQRRAFHTVFERSVHRSRNGKELGDFIVGFCEQESIISPSSRQPVWQTSDHTSRNRRANATTQGTRFEHYGFDRQLFLVEDDRECVDNSPTSIERR